MHQRAHVGQRALGSPALAYAAGRELLVLATGSRRWGPSARRGRSRRSRSISPIGSAGPWWRCALGCLRFDDLPGTAELQLRGQARSDRRQRRRIERMARHLRRAEPVLVVAVAARALLDDAEVPLDRVWPQAVRALRAGVRSGAFEVACHGLLHLDSGRARARPHRAPEFADLDEGEAGRRLDLAIAWLDGRAPAAGR